MRIRHIDCKIAKDYIRENHYSYGCHNGLSLSYSLFDKGDLTRCLMFAAPCSENVRASIFSEEYATYLRLKENMG